MVIAKPGSVAREAILRRQARARAAGERDPADDIGVVLGCGHSQLLDRVIGYVAGAFGQEIQSARIFPRQQRRGTPARGRQALNWGNGPLEASHVCPPFRSGKSRQNCQAARARTTAENPTSTINTVNRPS
jgi:hypothetical protein